MKVTDKAKIEVAAIDAKLDELRKLVEECETVTSVSIRIDEWGYDRHVAQITNDDIPIPPRVAPYYNRNPY